MIKAGIFDIGGVLQIQDVNGPLRKDVADFFGVAEEIFESFRQEVEPRLLLGTMDEKEYWIEFAKHIAYRGDLPSESLLLKSYKENFSYNEEVRNVIQELKEAEIRLACLTDTQKPHTEFNIKQGLYDQFEYQIFSHGVGMVKPDPRIYKLTLEKLNIPAEETFFVDDGEANILAAENLGITPILFTSPDQLKLSFRELGLIK